MMSQQSNIDSDVLNAFALGGPNEEVKKLYVNIQEGDILHCQVGYIFDFGHVVDAEVVVLKVIPSINDSPQKYLCMGKNKEGGLGIMNECIVHKDGDRLFTTKLLFEDHLMRFMGMAQAAGVHLAINRHADKITRLKPFELFKLG